MWKQVDMEIYDRAIHIIKDVSKLDTGQDCDPEHLGLVIRALDVMESLGIKDILDTSDSNTEASELTCGEFNNMRPMDKWRHWEDVKGRWTCERCGAVLTDGPKRSDPFHGCGMYCGFCGCELTRRTGGGQLDPFRWKLVPEKQI